MLHSARAYLVERFRDDARVLRERADTLARGTAMPGPDAETSRRMAQACDDVAGVLQAIDAPADASLDVLATVVPVLEQRAAQQRIPAVRAVYAGAIARIGDVRAAANAPIDGHGRAPAIPDDQDGDDA